MTEVAYSLEAMRALLMLKTGERGRAIETIEKLAGAYDVLCAERDIAAAAGVKPDAPSPTNDDDLQSAETDETNSSNTEKSAELASKSPDKAEARAAVEAVHIPGTLRLGTSANFCLAPFSKTGDFVVALDDKITVVSLIDVIDGLHEDNSE